jgi:hypothetical protein
VLHKSAEKCLQISGECLKQELFKIQEYPGASNSITFDAFGDINTTYTLMKIHKGKFTEEHQNKAQ